MNIYAIPVLIALIIKIFAFVFANKSGIRTRYLYAFIATFAVHNFCELCLFLIGNEAGAVSDQILRAYYSITFILGGFGCSCAIEIASVQKRSKIKFIENYVWLGAISGAVLSLFTDTIVTGATPLTYSLTAVKGDHYWIFQVTSVTGLILGPCALIREIIYTKYVSNKVRCTRMLMACIPMLIASVVVLILMQNNININATMVLPITSAFFLVFLIYSEREHHLTDLRRLIPGTKERQSMEQFQDTFREFSEGGITYEEASRKVDYLMIQYSIFRNEKNISKTANFMNMGRSTLYKKMASHGIDYKSWSKKE